MAARVLIIGLGLIGGSLARALRQKTGIETVYAADSDISAIKSALADGVIAAGSRDAAEYAARADIIFICTPAPSVAGIVRALLSSAAGGCIICDCASVKSGVIAEIEKIPDDFRFVGGHPMAGGEKSGYAAGSARLFENAYFVLTPCAKSDRGAIDTLSALVASIGALPVELSCAEHDEAVGLTSHLPHVMAAALVNMLYGSDGEKSANARLAAGGFRDLTRIASSDPDMWRAISMGNSAVLSGLITRYIACLEHFRLLLENDDKKAVSDFFSCAKSGRDALSSRLNSLIPKMYEIYVDVADRPGMISEVASVISSAGVNIKNINIQNSREERSGVMAVSLESGADAEAAAAALNARGISALVG